MPALIARYAKRILIENALSDAVRFFHMHALSWAVGLKVDFDMRCSSSPAACIALLARKMRGYADAQRATSSVTSSTCPPPSISPQQVSTSNSTAAPSCPSSSSSSSSIIIASGLLNTPVVIPWWNNLPLTLTA
ncbi:hypothetical protein QTI66_38185 [Variovorax sp. J22R133]|uniref:hypothetical protein n=1 Tax=Variovorax brevis TaxID=3053503 RepID=UPI002575ECA2|nr:hypothetical protein [Variovorax sp. J22R133]MDM0117921.1 hypothetical protein [Variovorax sp. J22R133]